MDAALYRNQFLIVAQAWESVNVKRAAKILQNTIPKRRSLEWYYLASLIRGEMRDVPYQENSPIPKMHGLNNGIFVVQNSDATISAIDLRSGENLVTFICDGKFETSIQRSRSGNYREW